MTGLNLDLFQQRLRELDAVMSRTRALLKMFNRLYVEYEDWFNRQRQPFLDAIKCTQMAVTTLLPRDITTMRHFRAVKRMSTRLRAIGLGVYGDERLDDLLSFWHSYCHLVQELSGSLMVDVCKFADSVTLMYDPHLQIQIALLHKLLILQSSEDFDFGDLRDSQLNHYTYRIMLSDHGFQGLVSFLPHLLRQAARLCHLVTRMRIEKE